MNKNIILDRLRVLASPPNPTLFYVFDGEAGPHIMVQPWGRANKLTWKQAENLVGMEAPRKPVMSSTSRTGEVNRQHRKSG